MVCSRWGEEFGEVGADQKPLTLPGAVFPSFGVGLSQDSLDPLRSKYETHTPSPPCCAWDPLGKGAGTTWASLT